MPAKVVNLFNRPTKADSVEHAPSDYNCTQSDINDYMAYLKEIQEKGPDPLPEDFSEDEDYFMDETSTYAFTINVYPGKRFNKKKWSDFTSDEQRTMLKEYIDKVSMTLTDKCEYEFEKTKSGNIHVHGMLILDELKIDMFKTTICKKFGLPNVPMERCCMIVKTLFSPDSWYKYMRKECK